MSPKKILVLTPIYPADDIPKDYTPVVHYFTREWVKQEHEVYVINYVVNYPRSLYLLASLFQNVLTSKLGFTVRTDTLRDRFYQLENVNVYRITMSKWKPHSRYSAKQIAIALNKTESYLEMQKFIPDVIISHWSNPTLEIMYKLKQHYNVPTCYIAHDSGHFDIYGADAQRYWKSIDVIGFRSDYIKREFESAHEYIKPSFFCYSGIPNNYCENIKHRSWKGVNRVAYVGTLISRKYPAAIVPALHQVFGKDFLLQYAGSGYESKNIVKVANELGVSEQVKLLGRIDRTKVVRLMDDSDLFIMISRGETFGLVYLEAMARGCIPIASRKEGFDGIIRHGYNGFLCEAGNNKELASIIQLIKGMTPTERRLLSGNAMNTAKNLIDEKVAQYYLEHILKNK